MKPRNFAFVVGFAVLAAFVLCMILSSCGAGTPDCPCDEYPSMDAGTDGNAPDWFEVHYSDCVHMCDAAEQWGAACGLPGMRQDCVEWLWYMWESPVRCESAVACYGALIEAGDCRDGMVDDWVEGWNPPTWRSGCPVDVP